MAGPLTTTERLTLWVSGITVVISVVALLVSFWANKISEDAYNLASQSYKDERRILLNTEHFKENETFEGIVFSTLESNAQIAGITIYFPSILGIDPIVLTPPDLKLYSSRIKSKIETYLKKRISTTMGYVTVAPHYPIQVLLITHGYTKGVSVVTLGIYDLLFTFSQEDNGVSHLSLKAGVLNNYTNEVDEPQKYIDEVFRQFEAYAPNE